jgi:mannose-6-phosphate isomerase-like protein (cupin superfamily)
MEYNADRRVLVTPVAALKLIDKGHAYYHIINETDSNILFRTVLYQVIRPQQRSSFHSHHKAGELYLVVEGVLQIETDTATIDVPERHVALVPPGVPHAVTNPSAHADVITVVLLGAEYRKEDVLAFGPKP